MNFTLWFFQVLLAIWYLMGGGFLLVNYTKVQGAWTTGWPGTVFMAYGILQILFAISIVIPKTSRIGAVGLGLLALAGCGMFSTYVGFPGMLWGVIPAAFAFFVAYGRTSLSPFKKGRK
jgi:hypothetical protein